MARVDPDRPLTDAQERALIRLADRLSSRWGPWLPSGVGGCRTNTLESLDRLGLAEVRMRPPRLDVAARITKAGLDLLATMGD